MKQLQFYKYATWGLLFLNLSTIAFFFLTAPPPPHGKRSGGKDAIDILKLDEQQNESFLQLAHQHMQLMDDFSNEQRELLKPYFKSLVDSDNNTNSDSLLIQAQLLERKKIESTYQHLEEVKAILKPEQLADFKEFVNHALGKILLEQRNTPPPK